MIPYKFKTEKRYNLSKSNTNSKIYKIVKFISENPGLSKRQILEKVMPEVMKYYTNGYYSSAFSGLVKSGILSKGANGRGYYITEKGMKILKEIEEKENKNLYNIVSINKIKMISKDDLEKVTKNFIDLSDIVNISKINTVNSMTNDNCKSCKNCKIKKENNKKQMFELILNNLLNYLEEKYEDCGKVISDIITQMQMNNIKYKKIKNTIEKFIDNCNILSENSKNTLLGLLDILIEFEN